mmetsp:Transcript_3607/g.8496  ORF Transcript_3607/g.8496 Transcript_3607/m.8496 type:complete len:505 (+) Transcript_3607:94-1608(+)|eukprot:CAMPEP_0170595548 /NCGR_PEP_ID=MMETSP0224-20130122/14625_1 /TAXON_ID=285029 /ORGANISM="Togula jolla, Strain CCCM 725" /LENGTH=504 /DNA_ID=CAMNT_0010919745 /DNA_START=93 /DNA_END=1607 /DNA_ORIENTATION=+
MMRTLAAAALLVQVDARADVAESVAWPRCMMHEKALRSPNPIYADVRSYINHPDSVRHRVVTYSSDEQVGMALQAQPHDLGEVVLYAVPGGQAERAGVRKGWIIKEIDGRPFSPTERLHDIAMDFDKARKSGHTLTVKYDVRALLDCLNGNCTSSDRFPTESIEVCAEACQAIAECEWWTFGKQDSDNECVLSGRSVGFTTAKDTSTGDRTCAPAPWYGTSNSWPHCTVRNAHIRKGGPVSTDVRRFISQPDEYRHRTVTFASSKDIGFVLREKPTALGEVVSDVTPNSEAAKAGVLKGWIIVEINGQPFRKGPGMDDANEALEKLVSDSPGLAVKFDVRSSFDCTRGDCQNSAKLPVESEAACASVCAQVTGCSWWTYGLEQEDPMCWLWDGARGLTARQDFLAGDRSCRPSDGWHFRRWFLLGLVIAAVKYRAKLLALMRGLPVGHRLTSSGLGDLTCDGGPVLELGKSDGLVLDDDLEDEEAYSLIGRCRKKGNTEFDHDL